MTSMAAHRIPEQHMVIDAAVVKVGMLGMEVWLRRSFALVKDEGLVDDCVRKSP